jgi:hypothetical protein
MTSAKSPEDLLALAEGLSKRGGTGILVSGGCRPDGSVPLERHLGVMAEIKRNLGLALNVHVGLCGKRVAESLASISPDAVSVDIIGDDATAAEIYGTRRRSRDFLSTYELLAGLGMNAVPHITIGLRGGGESGEGAAIESLKEYKPRKLVLNVLVPTRGTPYARCLTDSARALDVVGLAVRKLPGTNVILGCMRQKGDSAFESGAVARGVGGIVNPSRGTVAQLGARGMATTVEETCCAIG